MRKNNQSNVRERERERGGTELGRREQERKGGMQQELLVFKCCLVQMTMLTRGNLSRRRMASDSWRVALMYWLQGPLRVSTAKELQKNHTD